MIEALLALIALLCVISSIRTWYVCNFIEDVIEILWEEENGEE